MVLKLGVVLLLAVLLLPAITQAQVPAGRWEIVHTSGDNSAQTDLYPGGFSVYLNANGTANVPATFANSICVINADGNNVVPTWSGPGSAGNTSVTITVTVDNMGLGPNATFSYTGTYDANTPVPGDSGVQIKAITGTYTTAGASACSTTTSSSTGNFVATFLPDLTSGSSMGTLDGTDTDGGTAFDSPGVSATINYSTPSTTGQLAGNVQLASNPTLGSGTIACFATTGTTPNALTIDSTLSNQAGILSSIYADGFDPNGKPTTLVLQGYSANVYTTSSNTDPNANEMGTTTQWAAAAAIGEDDLAAAPDGVSSDGTNNAIVYYYNVIGGACDGAGGSDAPFHFLSGKPLHHHGKKHRPVHKPNPNQNANPGRGSKDGRNSK